MKENRRILTSFLFSSTLAMLPAVSFSQVIYKQTFDDEKAFNTMGLFFETLCVRDLRVFAEVLDGEVYHYRDKNGLECDAVIHLRNGKYGLVEIKLGGDKLINEGAENLLTILC